MKKSLTALAFGTFAFGISEFMMMGILPMIAADFGISIPQAGHFITAYALSVCVGAPVMAVVARKWPLRRIITVLFCIYSVAALLMGLCPADKPWLMLVFRAMAGFPHGAFFGAGSIIADKVSEEGSSSFSIAIMNLGMTAANLIGIPVGTYIATAFSWRYIFIFSAFWGLITLAAIQRWIPKLEALPDTGIKGQFAFLGSLAPWLIIFATMMGNGGFFCWYSYISPMLTEVSGVSPESISLIMVLAGAGMVVGILAGGRMSDRFGPARVGLSIEIAFVAVLLLIWAFAPNKAFIVPLTFLATTFLFAMSPPQQLLILKNSVGGQLMGSAMVQIAFNLGNAIGSYAGGAVIDSGKGYPATALAGAAFAVLGVLSYWLYRHRYERRRNVGAPKQD